MKGLEVVDSPGLKSLTDLEALCNRRVVVYCVSDYASKLLDDSDVPILYECLRKLGSTESVDFVFYCNGGYVNVARRFALLLHYFVRHLRILVPYKAHSAGTLLCLAAHQLLLGPLAELTPIDPHVGAANGQSQPGAPAIISAEDVRAFREMADSWFGLTSEEHRMQLFTLLSQRIFPTSLSSFYRADKEIHQIANELLRYQLPDVNDDTRNQIVHQLISGYASHDHQITREEAQQLGLQIRIPSPHEETLMWDIYQSCQQYMNVARETRDTGGTGIGGLIISNNFTAQYSIHTLSLGLDRQPIHPMSTTDAHWEIL